MKIIVDTNKAFSAILYTNKLVTKNIQFVDLALLPLETTQRAEEMVKDIDIDDTEFVALTDHLKGKLWTGDKKLKTGLEKKGWNNFITTNELFQYQYS